ncbi:unnamed protein product [Closterium sp. NIES-54]
MPRGRHAPVSWATVLPTIAHLCLLLFTCLLILKLQGRWTWSWWWVFCPLWVFHGALSRCNCSMPAPSSPYDRHWRPCHSLLTLPLLVAFELLLCCYLAAREMCVARPPVDLAIVFLPLILLEGLVLVDNFRMCMALMPGEDDNMTDEALWETLPHFAVAVSMIFFMAATVFSVLKLNATVFSVLELNGKPREPHALLVACGWGHP